MALPRGRRIAIVGLVLATSAVAATGITYAATRTTTKVVYACANRGGTLKLLSNGRCAAGYSKVAINKRGARGPRGPRGSTGPAGPGALTLHAASDNATTNFKDVVIPGIGLTAHAICSAGAVGTQSALYLDDTTASADYDVVGSYYLNAPGAHAVLVYQGSPGGNLASGLATVDFTQTKELNTNAEIVLQYDSGTGGQMTADVAVIRGAKKALVHLVLYQNASHCFVQADITPAAR